MEVFDLQFHADPAVVLVERGLEGDVELRPSDAATDSYLRTEALAIDTERNVAYSTRSPVTVKFGKHDMQVQSFEADLKSEKIRARSVAGRFVVKQGNTHR